MPEVASLSADYRRRMLLGVLFAVAALWVYANFSGKPNLLRFNEIRIPLGTSLVSHVVYGWPFTARQTYRTSSGSGMDAVGWREPVCAMTKNVAVGVMLLLVAGFFVDYAGFTRDSNSLRDLAAQRHVFRQKWIRVLLAAALILIAVVLLSDNAKSLTEAIENDAGPYFIAIDEHATRTTEECGGKLGYDPDLKRSISRNLTIAFMGGTMLLLGGIVVLLKRFSLKSAILTVLLAGGTGMLPMLLLPKGPPTKLLVSITIDKGLSDSQVATMRKALSPEVVIALLPQALKDAFAAIPNAGITRVQVKKNDSGDESTLTLEAEFAPALDVKQRNEIAGFLHDSFYELTVRAAMAQGIQTDFIGTGRVIVSWDWDALRNAWLLSAGPELDRIVSKKHTDIEK